MELRPFPVLIPVLAVFVTMVFAPCMWSESTTEVEAGKEVYNTYCVICHGDKGDGKGLMGIIHRAQQTGLIVTIYPRDFTAGVFKFRSTPSGDLPTDRDLIKIVKNGISRSGMPSHKDLSDDKINAVVQYIKTFSRRWVEEEPGTPIQISPAPSYVGAKKSIERGKKVYMEMKCWECHGETGLGDGPAANELKDDWGDSILAFDFTSGALKGGTSGSDLLRTFVTGLDGTPMPSYNETIRPDQQWDLVSYCLFLMKGEKTETAKK
jgi:mono/diheme cytochrome c family protein